VDIQDPDRELVKLCQDPGSDEFEEAFTRLYGLYKDRVYNLAWRVTGDPVEALDISQETFALLLRKISTFQFESKFSSWLYRIVGNSSIDSKRRAASRGRLERGLPLSQETGQPLEMEDGREEEPPVAVLLKEREALVQAAIRKLSPKLRAITVLRYMNGLAYEELAEVLQISLGTVKSRLARAHIALARHLGPLLESTHPPARNGVEDFGEPKRPLEGLQDVCPGSLPGES